MRRQHTILTNLQAVNIHAAHRPQYTDSFAVRTHCVIFYCGRRVRIVFRQWIIYNAMINMPFKSLAFHQLKAFPFSYSLLWPHCDEARSWEKKTNSADAQTYTHKQHSARSTHSKRIGKLAKLNGENLLLLHYNFSNYLYFDLNRCTFPAAHATTASLR